MVALAWRSRRPSGARPKNSRCGRAALLSPGAKGATVSPGVSPPPGNVAPGREETTNGRSPTDPTHLLAGPRHRHRRRAVRLDSRPGTGLQLEALPGQGALP